jgi:hypothetical protein
MCNFSNASAAGANRDIEFDRHKNTLTVTAPYANAVITLDVVDEGMVRDAMLLFLEVAETYGLDPFEAGLLLFKELGEEQQGELMTVINASYED